MIVNAFLVVEVDTDWQGNPKTGKMRVVKQKPGLLLRELAFELKLNIPDAFYKRVVPVVDVELPEDMITNPDPDIVVSITAGKVAEALKLEVVDVEEVLTQMLRDQKEERE